MIPTRALGSDARGRRAGLLFVGAIALAACGSPPPPTTEVPVVTVDRAPATRPAETVIEVSFRGGDAALGTLVGALPRTPLRAALPTRIGSVLDGLLVVPEPIRARVSSRSSLHVLLARVDGELRAAVAVELDEPVPPADLHEGGPRGASLVGDRAAVDDRRAVVSDDPSMLALAFAYLAYGATPPGEPGHFVAYVPASTIAGTGRAAIEQWLREQRDALLASAASARGAHDRPPDLGDPEALVREITDAALARVAYLPDLGDATLALAPTPSGLALTMEADVTEASPLDRALASMRSVPMALLAAPDASSAIVLASGASAASRAEDATMPIDALASIAAERMGDAERATLAQAATELASLRGDASSWSIGATDAGLVGLLTTRGGTDAPVPAPWGRALPWSSAVVGTLAGCTPAAPRRSATGIPICDGLALATHVEGSARADAIGRDAEAIATRAARALARDARPESPDLARDLDALSSPFAVLLVRPLRVLPVLSAWNGAPGAERLPRGDGALVVAASASDRHLSITARASTAALADLDVVRRLFAEPAESE